MEFVRKRVVRVLTVAGCLAPREEADELLLAAGGDEALLDTFVERRSRGEPLAWITGTVEFCGFRLHVDPGVYVPRPHTEILARRAATLLPDVGIAVDLCTGSGSVAAVMSRAHPEATIIATDVDPLAVACARKNGVEALPGDLDDPLPASLRRSIDVLTAVTPYVPTHELPLLPRDVVSYEPLEALDGGVGDTRLLFQVAERSVRWLRPGGRLLLELGGDQAGGLTLMLSATGFTDIEVHRDADGMDRAIEAEFGG